MQPDADGFYVLNPIFKLVFKFLTIVCMANRVPTSIAEAKGSFITHKNRQRPLEPTTDRSIGLPPATMTKAEKKVWKELVRQSCPGVLFESDRLLFAVLVKLATRFYANEPLMCAETSQMITLSSKFAMNPADRSKVAIEKPKTSSLTTFLQKKTA